jgi:hypothetical protein
MSRNTFSALALHRDIAAADVCLTRHSDSRILPLFYSFRMAQPAVEFSILYVGRPYINAFHSGG